MNISSYVFARLYGYTLGRKHRNDPTQACQDAITQFVIIVGIPVLCTAFAIFATFFPRLLASKEWIPWITVPAGVLMFIATRRLQDFAETPHMADPFRSPTSRRITQIAYIAVLVLSILVAGFTVQVLNSH
jgi:hypothetical protein